MSDTTTDTLKVEGDPKSSEALLEAITKAESAFNAWQALCDEIDDVYSRQGRYESDWADPDYDLFWSSMEIMKPAVYARPPQPVVSPQFKDRRQLMNITAELLERAAISSFDRSGIDEAMKCARDDLIFYNRGQIWLTYESRDGQKVCYDHLDRKDFLHPPARKWSDVPWAARRAWLTKKQFEKRFPKIDADPAVESGQGLQKEHEGQIGVWEVWHKADNKVYWVAKGVPVILDQNEPHLKLRNFFPCPPPAYGTLRPRSLEPKPDYIRYRGHFAKINALTRRIYVLLDQVKLKALIPAGGDVGDAIEQLVKENDDTIFIPVPAAALIGSGASGLMVTLPIEQIATTITGLIEARRELFGDFDRLSGISDIMRGETEAQETLGAQRLKSQYGSVRVREKVDELQRLARDVTAIGAEIMAENFSKETLLEMSQMEIPSKADIEKKIKAIETSAKEEMDELAKQAKKAASEAMAKLQQAQASGQQIDPQQIQQQQEQAKAQFQQQQQEIAAKSAPQLKQVGEQVPIEDVMKLLRDEKARGFAFEIATDSTILTDELQEKASRSEFLATFSGAMQGLGSLIAMGPQGAKLAGEMMKFILQPFRVGRELNGVIDEFIDAGPQMAAAMQQQGQDDGSQKAMAEANAKIADAELQKAQAAIAKVQADAQLSMFELQQKQAVAEAQTQRDGQRFELEIEQTKGNLAETQAKIEKIMAEIQKLGVDAQNQSRKEEREDVKAAADIEMRQTDQALSVHDRQRQAFESDRQAALGERQQGFTEQQGANADRRADQAEGRADRQQSFSEKQATQEAALMKGKDNG